MSVDCVEGADACSDDFEGWEVLDENAIWNGRDVTVLDQKQKAQGVFDKVIKAQEVYSHQEIRFRFCIELNLEDECAEEESDFEFAPCYFLEGELTFATDEQLQLILTKSIFKKIWQQVKKGAEKAAKAFEKAARAVAEAVKKTAEAIGHGTKKAAEKVADFVKEHKKETLIAAAVIAAITSAFIVSGALASAAAAGGTSKKKDDEDDQPPSASSPPPEPLPDWAKDLFKSTAPANATEDSIANAKKEAHEAWELFNTLKSDTESVLGSLKTAEFDPSKQSVNTILSSVLTDPAAKELIVSSNWKEIIRLGHERIDHAFSAVSAHHKAPPPKPSPTFIEKVQLGLEIIGRGMIDPDLLDPNMPVEDYLKTDQKSSTSQQSSFAGQTIGDFLTKITDTFNDQQALKNTFDSSILGKLFSLGKLPYEINRTVVNDASTAVTSLLGSEKSRYFVIEGVRQEGRLLTFANGMDNTFEEAFRNAAHIQGLDPDNRCIEGIYNHTNGKAVDVFEIFLRNYLGNSPVTQGLLAQKWIDFHEINKDKPNAKILHFCHSQGAIHTYNALTMLPQEIRDRIIVVAIAPAMVVPDELCFKSYNYASENDFVFLGELYVKYLLASGMGEAEREELLLNLPKMQSELIMLKPHEEAKGIDHSFQSPTFHRVIKDHLMDYDSHRGEYQ